MADLRELLLRLGHTDVRTHLQSGNLVFTSRGRNPDALVRPIEQGIKDRLGLSVRCLVRTGKELQAVIDGNPLRDVATDGSKMLALFLSHRPDPTLVAAHDPSALGPEQIRIGERVVYQWCPGGILVAPNISAYLEKHWMLTVTARNWNTVTRLSGLLDET